MKKIFILSAISIFTLSSFGTKELKESSEETLKLRSWNIYCHGVYSGNITCECNQVQATAIAYTVCYGNPLGG